MARKLHPRLGFSFYDSDTNDALLFVEFIMKPLELLSMHETRLFEFPYFCIIRGYHDLLHRISLPPHLFVVFISPSNRFPIKDAK